MDAKKTIAKLKGVSDRAPTTLYLSQTIYQDFKATCGEIAPSRVLEELMKEFIEDARKSRPKKKAGKKN